MYRFLFCLIIFLLVLTIRKIIKELKVRKEVKNIQNCINEFNYVYEQCESFIGVDIVFKETEDEFLKSKLNEKGCLEIDLSEDTYYEAENTKSIRKYLMSVGRYILLYEEELTLRYGKLEYNQTYKEFRKNYHNVRHQAFTFGEEIV